ncbi:MAG: DivIVA domain-containing protein [Acidobacteriota bacterium]
MKLTPMDIEHHKFHRELRGLKREEVEDFLRTVAQELQNLIAENGRLKDEIFALRSMVDDYRSREKNLQEMIYSAQRFYEDMKNKTKQEEELILKEARIKAEKLLDQAQMQVESLEKEILTLRLERDSFDRQIRDLLESHLSLLDSKKEEGEWKDRLRFIRRRKNNEEE